jgi:hypothetical protein
MRVAGRRVAVAGRRVAGRRVAVAGRRVAGRRVAVAGRRVAVAGRRVAVAGRRVALILLQVLGDGTFVKVHGGGGDAILSGACGGVIACKRMHVIRFVT